MKTTTESVLMTQMQIRSCYRIALLSITLLASDLALAQARPTATGPGTSVVVGGTIGEFKTDYGQETITAGSLYIDSNLFWRYGIETEARTISYPKFGERQSTLLAGPRWVFGAKGLEPYAKLLVGRGRFDFPYGYGWGEYFVVAPGAGLDLQLRNKIRVRLVDMEYQTWPSFTYGSLHPYGVSAGMSIQLVGAKWAFNHRLAK